MGSGRRAAGLVAALVLVVGGVAVARGQGWLGGDGGPATGRDPFRSLMAPGCGPAVVPSGQAVPAGEPEPLRPVWCYRLPAMAPTRVDGDNSWVNRPLEPAYRFHWDRVAVNPAGPPTPAPSFGLRSSSSTR